MNEWELPIPATILASPDPGSTTSATARRTTHEVLAIAATRPRENRRAVDGSRRFNQLRPRNTRGNSKKNNVRTGCEARTVSSRRNGVRAMAHIVGANEVDRRSRRKEDAASPRNAAQSRGVLCHANVMAAMRTEGDVERPRPLCASVAARVRQ